MLEVISLTSPGQMQPHVWRVNRGEGRAGRRFHLVVFLSASPVPPPSLGGIELSGPALMARKRPPPQGGGPLWAPGRRAPWLALLLFTVLSGFASSAVANK